MEHVLSSDSLQDVFRNHTEFKGRGEKREKNQLTKSFPQDGRS